MTIPTIAKAELVEFDIPLIRPYNLSFGTIQDYHGWIVKITLDSGLIGLGEALPVPGYSGEDFNSLRPFLRNKVDEYLVGKNLDEVFEKLDKEQPLFPVGTSAIATAIEFAGLSVCLPVSIKIPLVGVILNDPVKDAVSLQSAGYGALKMKIGADVDWDIERTKSVLDVLGDVKLRVDANKAYDLDKAKKYSNAICEHRDSDKIEYIEQPMPVECWEETEELIKSTDIPVMLDESIVVSSDAFKAEDIGVKFIKLKICKNMSPQDVLAIAIQANLLELNVVMGNGISTGVGCLAEAAVYIQSTIFHKFAEFNGFSKMCSSLLRNPPQVVNGDMVWRAMEGDGF